MKKVLVLAVCVLGLASCGSTARCGLANNTKKKIEVEKIEKLEMEQQILEASIN